MIDLDRLDLSFLVGSLLTAITLNSLSVIFSFDSEWVIVVEGEFECFYDGQHEHYNVRAGFVEFRAHRFIEKRVLTIQQAKRWLHLNFGNGESIRIISEELPYESGHINGHGRTIVF